jgi:hypothetical protein
MADDVAVAVLGTGILLGAAMARNLLEAGAPGLGPSG